MAGPINPTLPSGLPLPLQILRFFDEQFGPDPTYRRLRSVMTNRWADFPELSWGNWYLQQESPETTYPMIRLPKRYRMHQTQVSPSRPLDWTDFAAGFGKSM